MILIEYTNREWTNSKMVIYKVNNTHKISKNNILFNKVNNLAKKYHISNIKLVK